MEQLVFRYACALRTHHRDDAAIVNKLLAIGLTQQEASQLIAQMDQIGWTAESNSRATGIGWLSILLAVGVTGVSSVLLSNQLAIPLGIGKVIFVLPFVALGFVAHVAFSKLLERFGIHTSIATPIAIPDEENLRRMIAETR